MYRNLSLDSTTGSDVFYAERSSEESSPIKKNTPAVINSTELSGALERETSTISSVASPEQQIVTIASHSNEPTFPYGFGNQNPISPQPQGLQLATQPLQRAGYYGSNLSGRNIQPPITGTLYPVSSFYAPNEFQHQWRLGDTAYNHRWQYVLLFWGWA